MSDEPTLDFKTAAKVGTIAAVGAGLLGILYHLAPVEPRKLEPVKGSAYEQCLKEGGEPHHCHLRFYRP